MSCHKNTQKDARVGPYLKKFGLFARKWSTVGKVILTKLD